MKLQGLIAGAASVLAMPALAAPVDLTGWQADVLQDVAGQASWNVQPGNSAVLQTVNGLPTVFFKDGANSQGLALSGTIRVNAAGNWDDDFIGFVLGYSDGELNSATANFILIDWKQGNQDVADAGLAISHVSGNTGTANDNDFWQHTGVVTELERATNLGATGWLDDTAYTFDLIFLENLIQVRVNGALEISLTAAEAGLASFDNGSFGFYNFSQENVLYAGIEEDVAPPIDDVPAPAALGLLGLGLAGLGIMRRRKTA